MSSGHILMFAGFSHFVPPYWSYRLLLQQVYYRFIKENKGSINWCGPYGESSETGILKASRGHSHPLLSVRSQLLCSNTFDIQQHWSLCYYHQISMLPDEGKARKATSKGKQLINADLRTMSSDSGVLPNKNIMAGIWESVKSKESQTTMKNGKAYFWDPKFGDNYIIPAHEWNNEGVTSWKTIWLARFVQS